MRSGPRPRPCSSRGQRDRERGAAAGLALDADAAAVHPDELLHDAEPEAEAPTAELEVARRVVRHVEPGEERLEHPRAALRVDPDARVAHADRDPAVLLAHSGEGDGPAVRRELDRV